jgi:chaperonin cofactor prefoldin
VEIDPEDRILSSRVGNLEKRINRLEAELQELKYKLENKMNPMEIPITKVKEEGQSSKK